MQNMVQIKEKPRQAYASREKARLRRVAKPGPGRSLTGFRRAQSITLDKAVLKKNRLIAGLEPGSFSESFQLLHIRLLRRMKENNWKTLAVTSPAGSEGTTLTAANLAISMTRETGYTVILVDANLRRPSLLKAFGLQGYKGLSDYLTDDIPLESVLLQTPQVENLVLLSGGTPRQNSAELLGGPKMAKLVADLRACDPNCIVIFDLPPALASADVLAVSPNMESTLLVLEDGVTCKRDLERAMGRLDSTNIVGTVLNKSGKCA